MQFNNILVQKVMLRVIAGLMIALLIAACGASPTPAPQPAEDSGAAEAAAPTNEAVEITWLSHIYEPWVNALSAQGMQYMGNNENVKIVYSQVPHADLNTKIATSLAAGEAPTIMGVFGPWMPQLLEADALAPAPDWVKDDLKENFPGVMIDAATFDGEVYGYVQHIGIFLPIINEAMYEAAGVAPPPPMKNCWPSMKRSTRRMALPLAQPWPPPKMEVGT